MAGVSIPGLPLGLTGKSIPFMGFGTATSPVESNTTKEAILEAIKVGYRHFDTAAAYPTEKLVGEAIAEALSLGLVKSRDELFITSTLWPTDAHHDRVLPAIKNSLNKMGLEYLDLYLIHWPVALKGRGNPDFTFDKNDLVPMDFKSVWEAMEECQKLGLTKSIGVGNFSSKKLDDLLAGAKISLAVNQVEMSPAWRQKKISEFCEEKGILVAGYSPLGDKGTDWGTNKVMDSEVLQEIANAKGKTVAKICLRWVYEQGVGCIVKSYNKNRMKENLDIFDWRLNSEDLKKISEIPQEKMRHGADDFIHDKGPYKSLEELWDGEI